MQMHWCLNPVADPVIRWEAREIILQTAIKAGTVAKRLGWSSVWFTNVPTNQINQPFLIIDFDNGFKLHVGKSYEDNFIDLDTMEGGGTIEGADLHAPLLMLLACQKELNDRGIRAPEGVGGKDLLVLADEAGDVMQFPKWDSFSPLLSDVEPDHCNLIRELAVELGIVPEIIAMSKLQTDIEDFYF